MNYSKEEVFEATLEYFNGDKLATNVFMNKYCLQDLDGNYLEKTPDDMHKRLAKEFARMESKFGNGLKEDEIYSWIKNFDYIVPQGSPMYGIGNNTVQVSLSNCVVVDSPDDNVSSIVNTGKDMANLFKRRCGVGVDISTLRPDGFKVNNSARTTTGAWSFADFYSYVCRMIGQNGRRGALMISMDVRHPDIEKFITMKKDLTKVTGANISVKISDDFMEAVKSGGMYTQEWPIGSDSPAFEKRVEAKKVWSMIVDLATTTAEPGVLMWDNIINNLPAHSYDQFKTITTNPCGEIPLSPNDSCRLISQNLKNLVINPFTENAYFDFQKLTEMIRVGMRLSDDLVELELEKLTGIMSICQTNDEKELWQKLHSAANNGRRTGLGTHGLADAIARMNLSYDSEEAIQLISKIYENVRNTAYRESCELAKERGAFPAFNFEKEMNNLFIKRLPEEIQRENKIGGRRNISILTNAPTGSVSIMSQTSSGIEPVFKNVYIRRRKLNHNENISHDYVDELGDKWVEYKVYHNNVSEYIEMTGNEDIPSYFVESDSINWENRVTIQGAIQEYIDHSISSTINLPAGTKSEVVGNLYMKGWEQGLKGITVYVDGSRSGVLVTETKEDKKESFPQNSAPKRPEALTCDIHRVSVKGEKWIVLVGLMDNKPYEVIGGLSNYVEIPNKIKTGTIHKIKKGKTSQYNLTLGDEDHAFTVKDVNKVFDNPNNEVLTRLISLSLRHGSKINHVVEQLKKDKDSDMFSFNKSIARVLKKYIEDGTKASSEYCPSCESKEIIYQDGCVQCQDCGWSGCS